MAGRYQTPVLALGLLVLVWLSALSLRNRGDRPVVSAAGPASGLRPGD